MKHFFRYWFPLLAWMLTIFLFSHQDGDASSRTSAWVLQILDFLHIDRELLRAYNAKFYVRKLAHMTEYFILYLLMFNLIRRSQNLRIALIVSFLLTVAYACSDEFHQVFIPGRVGTIVDVGVDSIGASFAMYLCWRYQTRKAKI